MGLIATDSTSTKSSKVSFTNDLTNDDKTRLKEMLYNDIDAVLNKPTHSINDLVHLGFVAHGSIKSRSKSSNGSSRTILMGILDKTRAQAHGKSVSKESIKTFLASVSPEEKERLLQELLNA